MFQLANYWYVGRDATVSVSSSPTSLSFGFSSFISKEDSAASTVFKNIIQGNAHLNMKDPPSNCKDDEHYGPCGNRRESLTECRCKELDRLTQPSIRRNYENHVIQTVFKMIGKGTDPFHFKLASFCSGTLLGEEILLFRLLNELKKKKMKGTIEVFFIDTWYQPLIATSNLFNFKEAIEKQDYLKQFLTEMRQSLPEDIKLKVTFFSDSADYIQKAEDDARFKHHLLICADPGDETQASMQRLRNEAGLHIADPILLIKTQDKGPQVCQMDSSGNLPICSDPRNITVTSFTETSNTASSSQNTLAVSSTQTSQMQAQKSKSKSDDNSTLKTLGIGFGVAAVVSLLAYAFFKPSNKHATT